MSKFVFVTGGVCSSLGKGIASASLGVILEARGLKVCMIKIDPYLNVDAGTMNPYEHGEVYVTDDGAETDLDLGNYSRFTHSPLSCKNSITTGQVYQTVIDQERKGRHLGKCVQVVPHITDEIKARIMAPGKETKADVTIIETGGTVGDIESIPYLEAIRQIIHKIGKKNAVSVHLTLVPTVSCGEVKTKPTQHSVKEMREIGIQPDVLLCRCELPLSEKMKEKIALFTNIDQDSVLSGHNINGSIYEIPVIYNEQGFGDVVCRRLGFKKNEGNFGQWEKMVQKIRKADKEVHVALIGKYTKMDDTYKSIDEALHHGGIDNGAKVIIHKIESDLDFANEKKGFDKFAKKLDYPIDAILIPGGFGDRGVNGMIEAARYARENKIPCLGICLGLQVMVIEYCRNVLGLKNADSAEFYADGEHKVITLLADQVDVTNFGGTMRLGGSESIIAKGTKIHKVYGKTSIWERHRHRYEVANEYRTAMEEAGLILSGLTPGKELVECIEWSDHPWGVGVQFHPEFTSTPVKPGPLFKGLIQAAVSYSAGRK